MTAPELSPAEAAIVARFENGTELTVERVARAIALSDAQGDPERFSEYKTLFADLYVERARAAIEALAGPVRQHNSNPTCWCGPVGPLGENGAWQHQDGDE